MSESLSPTVAPNFDRLDRNRRRVLAALLTLDERGGFLGFREVAAEAGCSVSVAVKHLGWWRDRGFVAWEDGKAGTLRPLVEVVS